MHPRRLSGLGGLRLGIGGQEPLRDRLRGPGMRAVRMLAILSRARMATPVAISHGDVLRQRTWKARSEAAACWQNFSSPAMS